MSEPAEQGAASAEASPGDQVRAFQRVFGLGPEPARRLADQGYSASDVLERLTDPALDDLGLDPEDIERIRTVREARLSEPPTAALTEPAARGSAQDGEKILDRWVDSVRKTEQPRRRAVTVPTKDSADVLRRWVQGDDRALESWIQASEITPPPATSPPPRILQEAAGLETTEPAQPRGPPTPARGTSLALDQLREREETVVRWLTELLDRVKTDQFDPHSLLEEVQEYQRELYEERQRRKQLDEELEHVKRGSIAVIKYVRSREAKVREQAVQAKDAEIAELRLKILSEGDAAGAPGSPEAAARRARLAGAEVSTQGFAAGDVAGRDAERKLREEYDAREQSFVERETELRRRIVQLEGELRSLRAETASEKGRAGLVSGAPQAMSANIAAQLKELENRERELVLRENELRTKFEEIRLSAEEIERKREPLQERERELEQWEQQLRTARQAVELEARKMEQARDDAEVAREAAVSSREAKKSQERLNELLHKEAELKAREAFIAQRTEELEAMQRSVAMGEAERTPITTAEQVEKRVKSGVRRLDDLLFGGYLPASQVLVNGPAHTGKDVLARLFVAEGLKLGFPAVWVITDKTHQQVREEMTAVLPQYPEFEQKGMLRYVDLYARSLGVTQAEPGVRLLSSTDKSLLDQLTQSVNNFANELKDRFPSYRLAFESVSTVSAYLDSSAMFRFLQPFSGRRKLDGAASYFLLETGMHTESDLQTLEHMMDGSINLKVEQLKTFLQVRGLGETQSRAWIGYTFAKKSFNLGSFSLDHIR